MNYIKKLEVERLGLSKEFTAYHKAIIELKRYLTSEKFHQDTTVQVRDVLHRLSEAERIALDIRNEYDNEVAREERAREEAKHG
jgi:hypothetical protein